jgi:RNA polymerase sigma-70 factor (ECF subfamily)
MTTTNRITALAAGLFRSRGADLLRFLRQRLHSDAEARDIAQETYLRLIRLGDPDRIENPEAYLFRIASNLLWEHKLREQGIAGRAPLEETSTVEHTPFDLAISTQMAERVRLALSALPPIQRAVLILHLRDGLTCRDIGLQSGISGSMVKKHLSAALALCRRRLRDYE